MRSYKVVKFGASLSVSDVPTPRPCGSEVLLRVKAAGVCHTDLHIREGSYDIGHGKRLLLGERGVPIPLTMGHETVGEVVELGPEVSGVGLGDTRLIYPWLGCGVCRVCLADSEHMCAQPRAIGVHRDGGYSDYLLVPHARYLLDIGNLEPAVAAPYACSGLTTFSALKKAGELLVRDPILIIGAGGLGLMALSLLKAMGGFGAVVVDIEPRKLAAALAAGAISAIDGMAPDATKKIVEATTGPPLFVMDLVGSAQTADLAFNCIAKGGKIIIVGLFGGATPWALPLIPLKAATIQGSYVGSLRELKELLDLVRRKAVPPIPVTTRPLQEANQALEELLKGDLVGRAVLIP